MRVCLISNSGGTWIAQDTEILEELGHKVRRVIVEATFGPYRILKLLLAAFTPAGWSDVILCWFAFPAGFVGVVLGKLFRKPVVVNAVGIDVACVPSIGYGLPLKPHWRWLLKWTLKNANKVIAISQESAKNAKSLVERDVEVIYEGVDAKKFRPVEVAKSEKEIILTVGILSKSNLKRKGLETLVKSVPYVVKEFPNVKFVFVGRKKDGYPVLKELAEKLAVSDYVDFAGFKSDSELLKHLSQSAIFAMPSIHEGFPTVISEALACEKPIVATSLSAIPEVVVNNETGILINDPASSQELAGAIIMLLKNPSLRKKMGEKGRQSIIRKFSREGRKRRIDKLFTSGVFHAKGLT